MLGGHANTRSEHGMANGGGRAGRCARREWCRGTVDVSSASSSGGATLVAAIQATYLREGHDLACAGWLDRSGVRSVLAEGEVRAGSVVVHEVRLEERTQVGFAEDDKPARGDAPTFRSIRPQLPGTPRGSRTGVPWRGWPRCRRPCPTPPPSAPPTRRARRARTSGRRRAVAGRCSRRPRPR